MDLAPLLESKVILSMARPMTPDMVTSKLVSWPWALEDGGVPSSFCSIFTCRVSADAELNAMLTPAPGGLGASCGLQLMTVSSCVGWWWFGTAWVRISGAFCRRVGHAPRPVG